MCQISEIEAIGDSNYNFDQWLKDIDEVVTFFCMDYMQNPSAPYSLHLIGHYKDSGSYWLNHFPHYNFDNVGNLSKDTDFNSTTVRESFFNEEPYKLWTTFFS